MQGTAVRNGILFSLVFLLLIPAPYLSIALTSRGEPVLARFSPDPSMPMPSIPAAIPISSSSLAPVSGVLRVLIIAATFSDVNNTESVADIKQTFFGAVDNYYKEISYGAVSLQGDVVGWYRLSYVKSYYGKDCRAIDDTDCNGTPVSWQFARDALVAAQNDVNLTNYNYYLFVHAGFGEESSKNPDDIWSVTYLGGIWITSKIGSINKFAVLPELEARGSVAVGVYAHEFAHLLGLPDLYDTSTGKTMMGPWSLMDKGLWDGSPPGSSPSHLEAWSKIYLGWVSGSALGIANSGTATNFTIIPTEVSSSGVHVVEIPVLTSSPPSQYYLVEVRQRIGFDSGLPATGVLITYVNEKAYQGKVTVVDGHPNVSGLANATWGTGQTFVDNQNNIAVAIVGQSGNSYQIIVNRLGPMPDLVITRIFTQPTTISPNTTVTILIDIANRGTLGASNVPIQITLDNKPFAEMQATVAAGSTTELQLNWKAVAGSHQFRVAIDPFETIAQLTKAHKVDTLAVNVGPILIITVPLNATYQNATAWVKVNGVLFQTTGSQLKTSVAPGPVTVEVEPAVQTSPSTRQLFVGWSDGSSTNLRQVIVNSDTNLRVLYKTQYLLTVDRNGGVATQGGWFDQNADVTITATSPTNIADRVSQIVFTKWSGDVNSTAISLSLNLSRPITVRANWKAQYYLSVASAVGSPSGGGWYDAGATAAISVQSPVAFANRTRQVFMGWNGTVQGKGPVGELVVNAPTVVAAQWKVQYLVDIQSQYGGPLGAGWHDAGSDVQVSIQPLVDVGNRTRRIFDGWSGDYSGNDTAFTMRISSPKTLTARWTTQYQLVFKASGISNSTILKLNLDNAVKDISANSEYRKWFNQGQLINPATNLTVRDGLVFYQFAAWKDSTGATVTTPLTVDGPQDYTAVYTTAASFPPIPGFPAESILLGIIAGLVSIALIRRSHRRSVRHND